ncbi:MAG: methylmalonyl Co-A mutase-associated GTPase MeaB [FCB group bacterium]|jgi:LAO/AO transport system kinase
MKKKGTYKPAWTPANAGKEFAVNVVPGVDSRKNIHKKTETKINTKNLSVNDYAKGILKDDRNILARAITLIESNSPKHSETAQEILKKILPKTGKSIRIGITGSPGVGKSTFIESLGNYLCERGHKVTVLAIDPSSSRTKGSILADKTRMEKLARQKNAFIRPTPSGGALGGVARKTRETILLCEAAGFDVILIETIGVGQSEIIVRSMVDFLMLLILPGGGDELQGLKKGTVELADAVVINKADGDNIVRANITLGEYKQAVHYLLPATEGWTTNVFGASAINDIGIEEIWSEVIKFRNTTKKTGVFEKRRKEQLLDWVYAMVEEELKHRFYENPKVSEIIPDIETKVLEGGMTASEAVKKLISKT